MIKCLIIDDESLALDLIEDNISRIPFLDLRFRCSNAFEALEILEKNEIDLMILDIEMPGLSGIQLIRALTNKPMVIFLTAYKDFAVEGFELNVLDYLVKPVTFDRFLTAANKALAQHGLKQNQIIDKQKNQIYVYSEYKQVRVDLDDIQFIEGLKDYIKIHLKSESRPLLTRLSLKSVEATLPEDRFVRIHKSYIVSINSIESIRNSKVCITDRELVISDSYKDHFYEVLRLQSFLF